MIRVVMVSCCAALAAFVVLFSSAGPARIFGFEVLVGFLGLLAGRWLLDPTRPDAAPRGPRRRRSEQPESPADLERLERAVLFGASTAFDADHRLRPRLRELADERLRTRHGVGLADPEAASLLGPEAFAFLRPDRPPATDAQGPGVELSAIDRALTAIERL